MNDVWKTLQNISVFSRAQNRISDKGRELSVVEFHNLQYSRISIQAVHLARCFVILGVFYLCCCSCMLLVCCILCV